MAITKTLLSFLRKFSKLIIFLVIIISTLSFYNLFLIDRTLESLKFSLSQTVLAYDMKDTDGLDIILTRALSDELASENINSQILANLEFAKNIFTTGSNYKQLDYAKVALEDAIKKKRNQRGIFLATLDTVSVFLQKGIKFLLHIPQYLEKRTALPLTARGLELFGQAKKLEEQNKFEEAAAAYANFINEFPDSEKTALANLRLAYLYQRIGEFNKARQLYEKIIKSYFGQKEADIAEILLLQLKQKDKLIARMNFLLARSSELSDKDIAGRQKVYYELGVINSSLFNFEEARKFFKRANIISPDTDLGNKSLFNSAWTSKELNDFTESIADFVKVSQYEENKILELNSKCQLADIYHKEGRFQESIDIYLALAEKYKGDPIAALFLFQAGASYMYDLNNDDEARKIFGMLTKQYPNSPYANYLAPGNPAGIFVTYLVPRATRVVTWRAGGLLALSGLSGELAKFKADIKEEKANVVMNDWLKSELPDTIGNIYVDIRGAEIKLEDGKAAASGVITMGRFNVTGEAEGRVKLENDGTINGILTKAALDKIPIPPFLINNAISGISLIGRKYFPVIVTEISMKKGEVLAEGYGSKRILERIKSSSEKRVGMVELDFEAIKDPAEQEKLYRLFKERFPGSNFSPQPKYDVDNLFLDFFTRMYFYTSFKLLETVKDTKLDYERSVRTLGRLLVKQVKFGLTFQEKDINTAINKYIQEEFPWLIDKKFLLDIKGVEFHFTDNQEIEFEGNIRLGYGKFPMEPNDIDIKGNAVLDIDKDSGIPRLVFKKFYLNDAPYNIGVLNEISLRCLNLLKDAHLPFRLREVTMYKGSISLRGIGARDFINRVFSDPYLFVIFQIRHWDLEVAGVERLKIKPEKYGDFWRGEKPVGWQPGRIDIKGKAPYRY